MTRDDPTPVMVNIGRSSGGNDVTITLVLPADAEHEARRSDHKAAKLTLENAELRKQVAELERTIRGLQQPDGGA